MKTFLFEFLTQALILCFYSEGFLELLSKLK